jgi:hypothetical protein
VLRRLWSKADAASTNPISTACDTGARQRSAPAAAVEPSGRSRRGRKWNSQKRQARVVARTASAIAWHARRYGTRFEVERRRGTTMETWMKKSMRTRGRRLVQLALIVALFGITFSIGARAYDAVSAHATVSTHADLPESAVLLAAGTALVALAGSASRAARRQAD